MPEHDLTDEQIERLLRIRSGGSGESSALAQLVDRIRAEYRSDAPAVNAALGEFVEMRPGVGHVASAASVDVPPTPVASEQTRTPLTPSWRTNMRSTFTSIVGSMTGKILLGGTLALAATGGAHAAGIVDLPGLPDSDPATITLIDETTVDETTVDETTVDETTVDETTVDETTDEEPTVEEEVEKSPLPIVVGDDSTLDDSDDGDVEDSDDGDMDDSDDGDVEDSDDGDMDDSDDGDVEDSDDGDMDDSDDGDMDDSDDGDVEDHDDRKDDDGDRGDEDHDDRKGDDGDRGDENHDDGGHDD